MNKYSCPRCRYSTPYKYNLVLHIDKKKECPVTGGVDVVLSEYKEHILNCSFDELYTLKMGVRDLNEKLEASQSECKQLRLNIEKLVKASNDKPVKKHTELETENSRLRKLVAEYESTEIWKLVRETQKLGKELDSIKKTHKSESGNPSDYSGFIEDPIIKDIPEFEEYYQISENGEVYSKISGRELACTRGKDGYMKISLRRKGFEKTLSIHRMLASLFIPNPHNKPLVDHINQDRTDNSLNNLRWVSCAENAQNTGQETCTESGIRGITRWASKDYKYMYWRASISANHLMFKETFPYTDEGLEQAKEWRAKMKSKHHICKPE